MKPITAALLFAVHPVHLDAVDPITGRGDLLAAGFLLAAWGALHARREAPEDEGAPGRSRGVVPLVLGVILFGAALLSKELAVVLPALFVAGLWASGGETRMRRVTAASRDLGLLVLVLGVYLVLRTAILGALVEAGIPDPLDNPLAGEGIAARLSGAPVAWLQGARLLVWPWPLSPDYSDGSLAVPAGPADPRVVAGWALALGIGWAWVWAARRGGPEFLGLSILLAASLPSANLLFTAPVLLAERLLYLPALGFTLLLASAGAALCRSVAADGQSRRIATALVVAVVAIPYGLRALAHHPVYADDLALWRHAAEVTPGNAKAWYNLGNAWLRRSRPEAAAEAFRRSVERRPGLAIGWSNLGVARVQAGQWPGAAEAFSRALALDPTLAQAHAGLGSLALRRGNLPAARKHLQTSLLLAPEQPDAVAIGSLLERIEKMQEAGESSKGR